MDQSDILLLTYLIAQNESSSITSQWGVTRHTYVANVVASFNQERTI